MCVHFGLAGESTYPNHSRTQATRVAIISNVASHCAGKEGSLDGLAQAVKCLGWEVTHFPSSQNSWLVLDKWPHPTNTRGTKTAILSCAQKPGKLDVVGEEQELPTIYMHSIFSSAQQPLRWYPRPKEVKWLAQGHLPLDPKSSDFAWYLESRLLKGLKLKKALYWGCGTQVWKGGPFHWSHWGAW